MKNASVSRRAIAALGGALLIVGCMMNTARAQPPRGGARSHIIDAVTEDIKEGHPEYKNSKGGAAHNRLENVSAPVRGGKAAFRHWVDQQGERSEIAGDKTEIGGTYWYGWSMLVPEDYNPKGSFTILMQMAAYPTPRDGKFPTGGVGHKIALKGGSGVLRYDLQHAGETKDSENTPFKLGDFEAIKGKWVDYVMQAKWTGDKDGFLKLWMKIGDGKYEQKIDYAGRTWWNDEDKGPYLKMGAYMGDPGWKGQPARTIYTDEYRMGDAQAKFEDVAP